MFNLVNQTHRVFEGTRGSDVDNQFELTVQVLGEEVGGSRDIRNDPRYERAGLLDLREAI